MGPIQLQDKIGLTLKKKFIPNYLSKGCPCHAEFETLIKLINKRVLMWKMNA
jgi:hypothetical protein